MALGFAPLSSNTDGDISLPAVGGQHQRAGAVRQRIVGIRSRGQQKSSGFGVAHPRRKQQRRAAAAQDVVVQLFAARSLGLFADHGLRVDTRTRANVRSEFNQQRHRPRDGSCAAAHISAV